MTSALQTDTGTMQVATPAVAAFDLVRFAPAAGWWSNVATVLQELAERIDPAALVPLAEVFTIPDTQRLGWIFDRVGAPGLADRLAAWLEKRRVRTVLLASQRPKGRRGPDPRWRVIQNVVVEPDQ